MRVGDLDLTTNFPWLDSDWPWSSAPLHPQFLLKIVLNLFLLLFSKRIYHLHEGRGSGPDHWFFHSQVPMVVTRRHTSASDLFLLEQILIKKIYFSAHNDKKKYNKFINNLSLRKSF